MREIENIGQEALRGAMLVGNVDHQIPPRNFQRCPTLNRFRDGSSAATVGNSDRDRRDDDNFVASE